MVNVVDNDFVLFKVKTSPLHNTLISFFFQYCISLFSNLHTDFFNLCALLSGYKTVISPKFEEISCVDIEKLGILLPDQ